MIPSIKLTSAGAALLAKAPGGAQLPVTRWQIGTGVLPPEQTEESMTALVAPLKYIPISSCVNSGSKATILGQFVNTGMSAFAWEELGLWATDPDEGEILFALGEARGSGEAIQAGEETLREFVFGVELTFGNAANVTVLIDSALVFATQAELAGKADLDPETGKVKDEQLPQVSCEAPLKDNALKETPVDGDSLALVDSADSSKTKRVLWSRVKATLKGCFDALYAAKSHSHGTGDLTSGTLSVARGGTGKASWTANGLIYPSAAATLTQLAFPSAAGSVLRQGTSGAPYWTSMADLLTALNQIGGARIVVGSYVGTGTAGSANPTTITFPFAPKLVIFLGESSNGTSWSPMLGDGDAIFVPMDFLSTSYCKQNPPWLGSSNYDKAYSKKSEDGRTLSWYLTINIASSQLNESGRTYWYAALG